MDIFKRKPYCGQSKVESICSENENIYWEKKDLREKNNNGINAGNTCVN